MTRLIDAECIPPTYVTDYILSDDKYGLVIYTKELNIVSYRHEWIDSMQAEGRKVFEIKPINDATCFDTWVKIEKNKQYTFIKKG